MLPLARALFLAALFAAADPLVAARHGFLSNVSNCSSALPFAADCPGALPIAAPGLAPFLQVTSWSTISTCECTASYVTVQDVNICAAATAGASWRRHCDHDEDIHQSVAAFAGAHTTIAATADGLSPGLPSAAGNKPGLPSAAGSPAPPVAAGFTPAVLADFRLFEAFLDDHLLSANVSLLRFHPDVSSENMIIPIGATNEMGAVLSSRPREPTPEIIFPLRGALDVLAYDGQYAEHILSKGRGRHLLDYDKYWWDGWHTIRTAPPAHVLARAETRLKRLHDAVDRLSRKRERRLAALRKLANTKRVEAPVWARGPQKTQSWHH